MRKVLIIASLLHSSPWIPGLAKYLPKFGWQPIILTIPLGDNPEERLHGPSDGFKDNCRIIETEGYRPVKDMKEIMETIKERGVIRRTYAIVEPILKPVLRRVYRPLYNLYQGIFWYPDREKKWKTSAIKAGSELLEREIVDAMISSSPPVTAHIIAKTLRDKFKIPWIADFRDLWTQNHNYPYGPLRRLIERRLELRTLQSSDALVTVSQPLVKKLGMLHRGKLVYAIPNGFDPDEFDRSSVNLTSNFTITYTGQIYKKQNFLKFLIALKHLISNGHVDPNKIEARFYGPENGFLAEAIKRYELKDVVKQYGIVPRRTSLKKQRESQLLLLLNWEDPREKGVLPTKFIEYLGSQRPIIAVGGFGGDEVERVLKDTRAGIYASTIKEVEDTIRKLYMDYEQKGKIPYNGLREEIKKYTFRELAKKLAKILDDLLRNN
jgi:glycosyltransferase involved in cell wall biosynthesis